VGDRVPGRRDHSGIDATRIARDLGVWPSPRGQEWHFHRVVVERALPETWYHFTQDGGGKLFRFHWPRLAEKPAPAWHPIHRAALAFARAALHGSRRE